ncbi:MAG: aminotransferase class III-fold pyridoxal phosphate-dependent enzyme [Actinomycetia bacterium]|nr:aminotransferase class III-fold pyridoxal phosphate-dependent enzyme [Actinomycetes bacterium]
MTDTRDQIYKAYVDFVNPGLARLLKIARADTVEVSASGSIITDDSGKEYIDCAGGYGVFSLGHRHPEVVSAVKDQLDRMPLASKLFLNKPMADLSALLAKITPGALQYSFFVNSGAEAVENAIKLARLTTGKTRVISTHGAFHGKTFGALSASGRDVFREPFKPLVPSFDHVPFGDLDALSEAITDDTAALIIEPIQAEGGVILPPAGYLAGTRRLCDENNILLIADEIQTGLGRTGKLFAVEHEEVVPDIMTLAKALGGGVMPIGAVIGQARTWEKWKRDPLLITSTFGGNPLACAAAIAAVTVLTRDELWKRAHKLGEATKVKLKKIAKRFPRIIQDVRGSGLLIGVELKNEGLGGVIIPEMVRNGVAAGYTLNMPRVIRIEPPLVIEEDLLDQAMGVFEKAVEEAERLFDKLF